MAVLFVAVMADASELALALGAQVADSLQYVDNLPPRSPTETTSPPRSKRCVSEMHCFISGPGVARDSALPLPTSGQASCFVETSLLAPQVPENYAAPSHSTLPSVPAFLVPLLLLALLQTLTCFHKRE